MPHNSSYSEVSVRSKKKRHSVDHRSMIPHDKPDERHLADAYWTPSEAVDKLLAHEAFEGPIWEPACGMGNISEVLRTTGHKVYSSDKYDWGYGTTGRDFLTEKPPFFFRHIITNPPYDLHMEFLRRAVDFVTPLGGKVAFLMRLQYLEGKARSTFYEQYPMRVLISRSRLPFIVNGKKRRMIPYAWYIFDLRYGIPNTHTFAYC